MNDTVLADMPIWKRWVVQLARDVAGLLPSVNGGCPPGGMMMWGTATPPTGWLICDGSSVLRATYPNLFNAIGTAYGAADGTHFTLPDLRGRSPIGAGTGSGLTNRALNNAYGAETVTLDATTMPAHFHYYGTSSFLGAAGSANGTSFNQSNYTTSTEGSGGAHANLHPVFALHTIIKT